MHARRFVSRYLSCLAAVAVLTLLGCSGSGNSLPALDGIWQVSGSSTAGQPVGGPFKTRFVVRGTTVSGVFTTGNTTGNDFEVTIIENPVVILLSGTQIDLNRASGTFLLFLPPNPNPISIGTFTMQRIAPTGTMTANGALGGNAIARSSTTAVGIREFVAFTNNIDEIQICDDDGTTSLEIQLDAINLAVGNLAVGPGLGQVNATVIFKNGTVNLSQAAFGGNLALSRVDTTGIAGSYTINTALGSVTGTFNIARFDFDTF